MNTDFIPFHQPTIGDDEIRSVVETLKSGWFTTGHKVKTFEEDFARYVGAKHAVAVNSGTAALHLALDAMGITEGDEVIVPTMTFTATAEVVLYFKAKPVLVDCQRRYSKYAILLKLKQQSRRRPKRLFRSISQVGPATWTRILQIAQKHDLKIIEDAAHALPASYHGAADRHDWPYHLFFILCDQDDHDGRRRNGDDGEP